MNTLGKSFFSKKGGTTTNVFLRKRLGFSKQLISITPMNSWFLELLFETPFLEILKLSNTKIQCGVKPLLCVGAYLVSRLLYSLYSYFSKVKMIYFQALLCITKAYLERSRKSTMELFCYIS